ncbi:MAG: exonuclease domain-containing protein [Streptosporangiaceae bacterium]
MTDLHPRPPTWGFPAPAALPAPAAPGAAALAGAGAGAVPAPGTTPVAGGPAPAGPGLAADGALALTQAEFVVVDVETTGWSPAEARITEIGAVRLRAGRITGEFSTLVDPSMPIPPDIEALTGISSQMVSAAPPAAEVLPAWLRFADGCVLTAHNAPFDLGFLRAACGACGLPWPAFAVLDTVAVARQALVQGEVPDCKLATLAAFFETPDAPRHRALADARATAAVLDVLITRLALLGIRTLDELTEWLAVP